MVIISGSSGSIASKLIQEYTKQSIPTLGFDLRQIKSNISSTDIVVDLVDSGLKAILEKEAKYLEYQTFINSAAIKYVDVAESAVKAAYQTNVLGTLNILDSLTHLMTFIQISTDKAVYPVGVMGATKRLAELLVLQWANENPSKRGIIVRFGNVYGSSGSVVPLIQEQIKNGGLVLLTHLEATRYFITMQEAIELITVAEKEGVSGEIWSRDMGSPIRIKELAEKLIVQAGKEPYKEVQIKEIGLRPGEKLHEQLWYNHELSRLNATGPYRTVKPIGFEKVDWIYEVKKLRRQLDNISESALRESIFELVEQSY